VSDGGDGIISPDWDAVPTDAVLILCQPGTGLVLAYVVAREGGPAAALAGLNVIAPLLALLPPGAHPIPVN
jgi:hypothetical protein